MLLGGLITPARGQFVFNETFSHSTFDQAGWVVSSSAGGFTPTLTANGLGDASGSGWLRMTNNLAGEATYARLTTPIPSASNNITLDLKYQMWTPNAQGADGFTISLRDASVQNFDVGAFGGSLGYAQKNAAAPGGADTTHAGMTGGYFSVGVDSFGNFSNGTEGRQGGIGSTPNAVAVRGPGSGTGTDYNGIAGNNYAYVDGTTNLASAPYSLGTVNATGVNARPNTNTALTQAQRDAAFRELVFNFTTDNILTVSLRFGTTGALTQVFQADLSLLGARPENLELVFTAGTGGSMQYIDLQGLSITTTGAPVGTIYYSNYAGDNAWGNGNNWGNATTPNIGNVPATNANLVFSNHAFTAPAYQLTSAQNVNLGTDRTAASLQFDAPFNYTLQGHTLTLASGQVGVPTAITVTSAAPGGAHTIESALALGSDLNINLNTGTALNLSGDIAVGAHSVTLNNNGTVTLAGALTGSGPLTQASGSTGVTVLAGNSAGTFTGDLAIEAGTLRLGANNVLAGTTNVSLSTANSLGTFDLANFNQALGNITFTSGGVIQSGSGTLTLNGAVTSQASATEATISGNLNLGAAARTFSVANGGAADDMVVTAAISGTGGINKTGAGTLVLSGVNTFSGGNTLTAGTTIAASNTALGSGSTTLSSGATLGLEGGITLNSGAITVAGTGVAGSNGAIDNRAGDNVVASAITLAGNSTLGAASGTTLTLGGAISQSSASNLTVGGAGTVVLSGNNSYAGTTTVSSGATVVAGANNALGSAAAGTTVASGGTLGFQGGITYSTAETVTVTGTGAAGRNGALDNLAGDNTFAGDIALAGSTTIGANAGTTLTLGGNVSGANSLTVGGNGTVTLAGANTYSGTTTVQAGATLAAASNTALGTTGGTTSTTVANGGTLGLQGNITLGNENLTINGSGADGNGALTSLAGANSVTNQVTLAGSSTIGAAAGATLTLAGGLTDGASTYNVVKADAGKVVVAGTASYNGTTSITGGTLEFAGSGTLSSAANITVTNGTLSLDNSGTNLNNRISNSAAISLSDASLRFVGNGSANSTEALGTVTAAVGTNSIYLQAGAGRQADLTLGNLVQSGSGTMTFTTDFSATLGSGATSAGSAGSPRVFLTQINGVNTGGSLATPTALAGWILVTDSAGAANFAEYTGGAGTGNGVRALTSYYTGALGINVNDPTKSVLLTSASPSSAYTLTNGGTTTDANLKITDLATVNLNTSTTRTLRLNSGGLIKSGATTTTISGSGRLSGGSNGTLAVTVDNAGGVLNINSVIVDNGTTGLTKAGAGLLSLGAANTFTGNVNINDGILRISAESGLGATNASKTIGLNGGTLSITTGFSANTAKTWTVGANTSGTLDINAGQTLSLTGTGDLTSSTTSTLIKAGAGMLVLGANNTGFTGTAVVSAGTLELDTANALGTNRTIALDGGTLRLENNAATTFANNITVSADSTVTVDRRSTGTNRTHTLGTLAMGTSVLTVTGANGFDLRFGDVTVTGDAVLNPTTVGSDLTLGAISGTGSITKNGAANLTITAASTYAGATTVNAGALFTQGTNYLPTTTTLTIANGATVDTNGSSQTLGALAGGTGTATLDLGTGTLTVGNGLDTTFGGTLTAGAFVKNGSGTLTLSGGAANTLSSFTINDGTIAAAKSGTATGSGNVLIGDGNGGAGSAVLVLGAANQIADTSAVTLDSDGRFDLAGYNEGIASLAGAGSVALGNATLSLLGNASTVYSGAISGSGGLAKNGTGTLSLSGDSSYTGPTAINQGAIRLSTSTAFGAGSAVTVASGASLEVQNNVSVVGSPLSLNGTGNTGEGALRNLSGDNTWTGTVTLAGNATVSVAAGNLYLGGGVATNGHTATFSGSGNTQVTAGITGTGSVVKDGIGTLVLSATNNSYTGATTVNAGSLQIDGDNAGPASSAVSLAAAGASLNVNNHTAAVGSLAGVEGSAVVLGGGSLTAGGNNASTTYSGSITGAGGSFTKVGTGTLTLDGTMSNALTGTVSVNDGTLLLAKTAGQDATGTGALVIGDGSGAATSATVRLGATDQINNSVAVQINGDGRLDLNGHNETIGSLAGNASTASVTLGSNTLTAGGNGSSTSFAGVISGLGGLTKVGAGTMTLANANTYSGPTQVNGGTLALAANQALAAGGSLTISSGAGVTLAGGLTQTVAGLTTATGATINLGANATLTVNTASATTLLATVTGTGTLALLGGGNLTLGTNFAFGGELAFGGTTIGGTPVTTLALAGNVSLGTLHITGDTILDFGNSAATTLNATNLIIDANVKVSVINWVNMSDLFVAQNFAGAVLDQRGNSPIPNNASTQITFTGFTNDKTAWTSFDHEITPAPEPAAYGAAFTGLTLLWFGWRRRRQSSPATLPSA